MKKVSFLLLLLSLDIQAKPTVEEEVLIETLRGNLVGAELITEKAMNIEKGLRSIAGRIALSKGALDRAIRYFSGDDPESIWGRIFINLEMGKEKEALSQAIAEMDKAIQGKYRENIVKDVLKWAHKTKDRQSAYKMVEALLPLEVSKEIRKMIEDALFQLWDGKVTGDVVKVAKARIVENPNDSLASRVVGLSSNDPYIAFRFLEFVVGNTDKKDGFFLGKFIIRLQVPVIYRLKVLEILESRFSKDEDVLSLRLDFAQQLMQEDPAFADKVLEGLLNHPKFGSVAMELYAKNALDPLEKRRRYLELVHREGMSSRAEIAKKEALSALIEWVMSQPSGYKRREIAKQALKEPDASQNPYLLYYATDQGGSRKEALFNIAERYPGDGPWCEEIAQILVSDGVGLGEAKRYRDVCKQNSSYAAKAITAFAEEEEALFVKPSDGRLLIYAVGYKSIKLSENRLYPLVLFRANQDDPTNTSISAFLMKPDTSYEITLEEGRLKEIRVKPRLDSPLLAVQVRGGDRLVTLHISPDPIRVETILKGDTIAVGALRGDKPVGGAQVVARTDKGIEKQAVTNNNGVAILTGLEGMIRVMVLDEKGMGFVIPGIGEVYDNEGEYQIVLWDKAYPVEGKKAKVLVFGTKKRETLKLTSYTSGGVELEHGTIEMRDGIAKGEIWVQGGGTVLLQKGESFLDTKYVPLDGGRSPDIAISFIPASPKVNDTLTLTIFDTGFPSPDGKDFHVSVNTPWGKVEEKGVIKERSWSKEIPLTSAEAGDKIEVSVNIADHDAWAFIAVEREKPPRLPKIPPVIVKGHDYKIDLDDDVFLLAISEDGKRKRWIGHGESFVLDFVGRWNVRAWRKGQASEDVPVLVLDEKSEIDERGMWKGERPRLIAFTNPTIVDAKIVGKGTYIGNPEGPSWVVFSSGKAYATMSDKPLDIEIEAELKRGTSGEITIEKGLPKDAQVWAFIYDASDYGVRSPPASLGIQYLSEPGQVAVSSEGYWMEGEVISQGILKEEMRHHEKRDKISLELAAEKEREIFSKEQGIGVFGAGGSGGGVGSVSVSQSGAWSGILSAKKMGFISEALGVVEGKPPGKWKVEIPNSVTQIEVVAYIKTRDGKVIAKSKVFPVLGPPPIAVNKSEQIKIPEIFDGSLKTLMDIALSLRGDMKCLALASLVKHGLKEGEGPLFSCIAQKYEQDLGKVIANKIYPKIHYDKRFVVDLVTIPDQWQSERAEQALKIAAFDSERAVFTARRLLQDGVDPWIRIRAGLALWLAGSEDEARKALSTDDSLSALGLSLITGIANKKYLSTWWTIAVNPYANQLDRALSISAIASSLEKGVSIRKVTKDREPLFPKVEVAIAQIHGKNLDRNRDTDEKVEHTDTLPKDRETFIEVEVFPYPLPTTLVCTSSKEIKPLTPMIALPPAFQKRKAYPRIRGIEEGEGSVTITLYSPLGDILARGETKVLVSPPKSSSLSDSMTKIERLNLGIYLAREGNEEAISILEALLKKEMLSQSDMVRASEAILIGSSIRNERLIPAFEAFKERCASHMISIETASSVARAYYAKGEYKKAWNAIKAVLEARFKEEVAAFQNLKKTGLMFTSLQLLESMIRMYPDVPSVINARYLIPSVLLEIAESKKDGGEFSHSEICNTAIATLSKFLILHPESPQAPEAAVMLTEVLEMLGEYEREYVLAPLLVKRYQDSPRAWMLRIADARAKYSNKKFKEAFDVLKLLEVPEDGRSIKALEMGKILQALKRDQEAIEEYRNAYEIPEARARADSLERSRLELPTIKVYRPWDVLEIETGLRGGSEVDINIYKISLEMLLILKQGKVDLDDVKVEGLRSQASMKVKVKPTGAIVLPNLSWGAYMVTVSVKDETKRTIVVRTDAVMRVETYPEGILINVTDSKGTPLQGAEIWAFTSYNYITLKVDSMGYAWIPDKTVRSVLAKALDSYYWYEGEDVVGTSGKGGKHDFSPTTKSNLLEKVQKKNIQEFENMFIPQSQGVEVKAL